MMHVPYVCDLTGMDTNNDVQNNYLLFAVMSRDDTKGRINQYRARSDHLVISRRLFQMGEAGVVLLVAARDLIGPWRHCVVAEVLLGQSKREVSNSR